MVMPAAEAAASIAVVASADVMDLDVAKLAVSISVRAN